MDKKDKKIIDDAMNKVILSSTKICDFLNDVSRSLEEKKSMSNIIDQSISLNKYTIMACIVKIRNDENGESNNNTNQLDKGESGLIQLATNGGEI